MTNIDASTIVYFVVFSTAILTMLWFTRWRKVHREFIAPPKQMPAPKNLDLRWFDTLMPGRTIWKLAPAETQEPGSVQCIAYSLRSLMLGSPLNITNAPSVDSLWEEVKKRDDQKNNSLGGNTIGAVKYLEQKGYIGGRAGIITKLLRSLGFRHSFFNFENIGQIKSYVKNCGPVIAGVHILQFPRIDDQNLMYTMEGPFAYDHAVLVYGIDENMPCPDGSTGAFRVRWHLDWFGTDGWMPVTLFEGIMEKNWTYGFKYHGNS